MSNKLEDIRWNELFPQQPSGYDFASFAALHHDRVVLVTGAGGSIGAPLSRSILQSHPRTLILLDSSEQNLYYIDRDLARNGAQTNIVPALGSVADADFVGDVFRRFRPHIVYHAAALKHVPLGEKNPFAVVQNNVFGTAVLCRAASEHTAARLLMVSTDKSVNPESIMGASKRLSELLLYRSSSAHTRMTSIRLGNVLGSEGSVVPLFLKQIADGGPLTVTDPRVARYFFTVEDTVLRVLAAMAACPTSGDIAVPVLGNPIKIADLAQFLIEQTSARGVEVVFTGLRPGDKLHEEFVATNESLLPETTPYLKWVKPEVVSAAELRSGMAALESSVQRRDLGQMLEALTRLVPEYRRSQYLREQVETVEGR